MGNFDVQSRTESRLVRSRRVRLSYKTLLSLQDIDGTGHTVRHWFTPIIVIFTPVTLPPLL